MAYHGYIDTISKYCINYFQQKNISPKVLEIGIDKGITAFSLLNNLNSYRCPYEYYGVDIRMQLQVTEFFKSYCTYKHPQTKINLIEENSLDYLPKLFDQNIKFDVILVDGDHNYETVNKECNILKHLYHDDTLFIFDDYNGEYSYNDMFYGKKDGYQDKNMIFETKEKSGIKEPIDRFIEAEELIKFSIYDSEPPICAITKNNRYIKFKESVSEYSK